MRVAIKTDGIGMHIGFRTSGGRGEYEVVGSHSGYNAASLEGWAFYMLWPDNVVRDTGLWLDPGDSGKPRLRSTLKPEIQIGRIIASMLMLPDPTRAFRNTPQIWPILIAKKYTVTQLGFSPDSDFAEIAERVTFVPSWVEVANQGSSDAIGISARWQRIEAVYDQLEYLPAAMRTAVASHRDYLATTETVTVRLSNIVSNICKQLKAAWGLNYEDGTDPLPYLEDILSIPPSEGPGLPAPDELSEDEPEISARSAHEYRLARIRGISGRRFSEQVRAAYGHTCAFCGAKFGGIRGINSGVDAAHILAWSKHDLDIVTNGITLCKLHHWAFDAGIVLIRKNGHKYYMHFTTLADRLDEFSQNRLGVISDPLPEKWLPSDPKQRPSEQYLQRLYADLGVTWRVDSLF
ncbi:MAG TPA: HNH endonuclease [Streptosporangiaceae bacterium]|nr:HNH endonuclease [Streptosporangiaceae bacterium]